MMAGSVGMCICEIIIGVIVATCANDWTAHSAAGWTAVGKQPYTTRKFIKANISVVFVWLYIINFAYSWGPGSWILIAEIFPISIRAKGTSIGASANWMNNFIIAFVVPPMLSGIGWGTYIFFAFWSAAGGIFIWLCMPETKGKTLEEMDQVFGSHTAAEDLEEFARVQERVGLTALIQGRSGVGSDQGSVEKEGGLEVQHISKV
jgi:hypothetical protein